MEAPIGRIAVLRLAGFAHNEARHRCLRAIVWYLLDDGVARTTVCAICEWIAEAAVKRIAEVAPAGVAGAGIGRDQSELTCLLPALDNVEA